MPTATPCFVIGRIRVKDATLWVDYRDRVPATLEPWRGEILARGRAAVDFSGASDHELTVVIRFPDDAAMRGWHDSPAYRALLPLRQQAAEVVLTGYEG